MGFRMFANHPSPIAIDFGTTSVKLLQSEPGEKSSAPSIMAAAELVIPDDIRLDAQERMNFLESNLPGVLKSEGFRGKRAVCAIPTSQTILQHLQIAIPEGVKRDDAVKSELQLSMGLAPGSFVVRSYQVAELNRDGQMRTEVICIAIPRDVIMRHLSLLEKLRMEVTGIHAQSHAVVRAFDHIHRRDGDEQLTTMYIDLGWSGTCVTIAHGREMVFARAIQVGGQHFDQLVAKAIGCDLAGARAHRLSLDDPKVVRAMKTPAPVAQQASSGEESAGGMARLTAAMNAAETMAEADASVSTSTMTAEERRQGLAAPALAHAVEPGEGHTSVANVDFSELLETLTDELSMSLRYHRGLFPSRTIDRVVLLGGEARQNWLCKHLAQAMRLPARLGDPLARFRASTHTLLDRSQPQPGWTTACGLCATSPDC